MTGKVQPSVFTFQYKNTIQKVPVTLLASVLEFVEPRFITKTVPIVSKQWCFAIVMYDLRQEPSQLTPKKICALFKKNGVLSYCYRFEHCMRVEVPIAGKVHPDFFNAIKKEYEQQNCYTYVDREIPAIWKVAHMHPSAKTALLHGAAESFGKELQSLLPKYKG